MEPRSTRWQWHLALLGLWGCYKGRKLLKIWLKNQISKEFDYNNVALRGTLACVLGKNMERGSEARKSSTEGWH